MLDNLIAHLKNRLPLFGHKTFTSTSSQFCCISIAQQRIYLARAKIENHRTLIQHCDCYSYDNQDDLESVLATMVKENQLQGVPCSWILHGDQYQIIQSEALPVSTHEFQAAIRWKVRELVHFPIEEAVIDSFALPQAKIAGARPMIMVIIANQSFLRNTADVINASGLNLQVIDVTEMGLRNITSLYEKDEKSTALIYFGEKNTNLLITHQKTFYLIRRLDFNLEYIDRSPGEAEKYIGNFALELQRSFDYYVSQWRLPAPSRVLFSATRTSTFDIPKYLLQRLSVEIEPLDIMQNMVLQTSVTPETQGRYLPVLGGILRKEVEHNATAN